MKTFKIVLSISVSMIVTAAYVFGCIQLLVFVLEGNAFVMGSTTLAILCTIAPVSVASFYGARWVVSKRL